MKTDVKQCVDARLNFFEQYYTVPEEVKSDVDGFRDELLALAENCGDATSFEATFVSSGLSDRFNNLIIRCTPKPYQMSEDEKAYSKAVSKQMFEENKGQIAKDIAADVAESAMMAAESEAVARKRQIMIETGTFDEYTRATNAIEDVGWAAKTIGKFFKKKDKK